eukprot:3000719-Lingulodinium_polyedra.AAC.1
MPVLRSRPVFLFRAFVAISAWQAAGQFSRTATAPHSSGSSCHGVGPRGPRRPRAASVSAK